MAAILTHAWRAPANLDATVASLVRVGSGCHRLEANAD
jgi:hypothetical protein